MIPIIFRSIGMALVCLVCCRTPLIAASPVQVLGGVRWSHQFMLRDVVRAFNETSESSEPLRVDRWGDERNIEKFIDGQWGCEVLYHRALPSEDEAAALAERWPEGEAQAETFVVGQMKVAVIVHRSNRIPHITLEQVRRLLRMEGEGTRWAEFGGTGGVVRPYGEGRDATSRLVVRRACMMLGPKYPTGYQLYREDFEKLDAADEVVAKVRTDRNGIGFILYDGQPIQGVKMVPVARTPNDPAIALKDGKFIQPDYPLAEWLVLYLRPDASPQAQAFFTFATSEAGAEIAAKHGLITSYASAQAESEARLAEMKQGRGDRIEATGAADGVGLMNALAVEYTRLASVVQMRYVAVSGQSAMEGMLRGKELMLLRGRVETHDVNAAIRAQWSALASPADGSAGVAEHHIASRAVAVVTHSLNKLDWLSTDQLRAIFSGEVRDWRVLAAVDPDVVGSEIRCYGPEAEDPIFKLFFDKLEWRGSTRVDRKTSSQDVLSALSIDPQGIAFVNLADLPDDPAKMGIKVLAIRKGRETVHPASQTVLRGDYPLAEHFFLYIHPHRGDAARDYADFILTSDSATDIFRQNGFLHALDRDISD